MTRKEFERVVDRALEDLPPWVVERLDNLVVVVEDRPTRAQDPDGSGLLGYYEGTPLTERTGDYWGVMPDQITLFRQSHLALGLARADLEQEIRKTLLHEIAHYLGMDERRLEQIGWD